MRLRKLLCALVMTAFALPLLNLSTARADEGMWPFNNVPRAEIKRKYNFDVTDAWLKKVQMASVRFNNGGSGSFVSPEGLVMTNHHIASDTLSKISTPEKDYMKDGFYARTQAEEVKSPDLELNVLVSIEDVTARVTGAIKSGMSASEAQAARSAMINSIAEESTNKNPGLRSDVVALYQGGQYNIYRYKKYTDVRLVFAPEFGIAFFGGDPDNFEWPRYNLDLALFRVYENDKPVHVENYFKWSKNGTKPNELVFVSGHPGSTSRLNTMAHLEYLRDTGFPFLLKYLKHEIDMLEAYGAQGDEKARLAQEELLSFQNSYKARLGGLQGLQDKAIMAKKKQTEDALRKTIAADAKKQKDYGDAWEAIARGRGAQPTYERERRLIEGQWGFNSTYFDIARKLVRLAYESAKPNAERLPEYTESARASFELGLYSPAPIYDDFEKAKLTNSLSFMKEELGAEHPVVKKVLNGKTAQERAAELIEGTRLKDVDYRKQLAAGGVKAIEESTDPMIMLARSVDAEARAARKRYEDEVVGVERTNYNKIARALFETEGTKLYPDATFTLRLAYGTVKGYESKGKKYGPYTDFAGMYQHAAEHGNKDPWQLPARWEEKRSALNLKVPFNFVNTTDIIGGNSGSPVINKDAEIVGLIFDGNIESLLGDFIYDESTNRAIAVDSRGMIEALRKVYGMNELADELMQ